VSSRWECQCPNIECPHHFDNVYCHFPREVTVYDIRAPGIPVFMCVGCAQEGIDSEVYEEEEV
jgi:hypothetical protein